MRWATFITILGCVEPKGYMGAHLLQRQLALPDSDLSFPVTWVLVSTPASLSYSEDLHVTLDTKSG